MSLPDSRDLPLQGTELQANTDEPVPVLQAADGTPPASPDVRRPVPHLSPLGKRLQVLLRLHEAAGWARMWKWIWFGVRALVVLGAAIPLAIGVGNAAFYYHYSPDQFQSFQAVHHAEVVGWAIGLGTAAAILLLWAIFEWLWKSRYAPLEEQIAAIVRDHAAELAAWGGPSVLREPAAVAEILHQETRS